ncbi:TetR/AcrR family transcriptional regulator [Streptomyces rubiginosohelvolus]|uniref:TetR family transcriptional regulator n=1 Tax=Streptomyces rubiginosohelvolus TaxID=67362 RepID=A0ABQ3BWV9_9ACTN|nr:MULTISPECIES: TetR/AcrR family transcriptional regulator [Streptomyces]GGS19492.1 TetR family transcriptional regulator [Streptomyces rubiginosohelvolus]GGZ57124.1 TetR family transcriptional regulator [Streptomyces pluricolorescens]
MSNQSVSRAARSPAGPRKPRSPEARQRQQDILAIAMDTFAARGYNNASLAEIADRVGLTQAGVLHYFRSKALLLTSVLELRDQRDIEQLGPERPQGLDFLRHLVNTALRNAEREGIVRLYAVLSAESVTDDHPAQDYFRDRYDGLRAFVADALREACELPADRAESADNAANAIIAVMDGLQVQWLLAPESVDMAASTDLVVTSLLATLAPERFGPHAAG